jgi:hypothetical protein
MKTISLKRMIAIVLLFAFVLTAFASKGQLLTKVDSAKFETFSSSGKSSSIVNGDNVFISATISDRFASGPAYPAFVMFDYRTNTLTDTLVYRGPGCYPAHLRGALAVRSGNCMYLAYEVMYQNQVDLGIVKTDLNGNFIAAKKLGSTLGNEYVNAITATSDGGIAVIGTYSVQTGIGPGNSYFRKIKVDMTAPGSFKYFRGYGQSIVQLPSGQFVIAMNDFEYPSNYLLKTTAGGDSLKLIGCAPADASFQGGMSLSSTGTAYVTAFRNLNTDEIGVIKGNGSKILTTDTSSSLGAVSQIITKSNGGYKFLGNRFGTIMGSIKNNGEVVGAQYQSFLGGNVFPYAISETRVGRRWWLRLRGSARTKY